MDTHRADSRCDFVGTYEDAGDGLQRHPPLRGPQASFSNDQLAFQIAFDSNPLQRHQQQRQNRQRSQAPDGRPIENGPLDMAQHLVAD